MSMLDIETEILKSKMKNNFSDQGLQFQSEEKVHNRKFFGIMQNIGYYVF